MTHLDSRLFLEGRLCAPGAVTRVARPLMSRVGTGRWVEELQSPEASGYQGGRRNWMMRQHWRETQLGLKCEGPALVAGLTLIVCLHKGKND